MQQLWLHNTQCASDLSISLLVRVWHVSLPLLLRSPETFWGLLLFKLWIDIKVSEHACCVCVWAVQVYTIFTTLVPIIYSPYSLFMASLRSVLVMFLPPHHIPIAVSHRVELWSFGSVGVVLDNKRSAYVSIATPHDPNGNCLIRDRWRKQPDIKVGLRGKEKETKWTEHPLGCN